MRLTCASDHLRSAVTTAQTVVPSNPKLVAYSGVLVHVTATHARVVASDGDAAISVAVPSTRLTAGQALLPPKPLGAYLATIASGTAVTLEMEESGDVVVSADGRPDYRFRPLTSTFPMPAQIRAEPIPVDWSGLSAALKGVKPAVSRDYLVVQLVSDGESLVFNSTDNYRLHRSTLPKGGFGEFTGLFSLPMLELAARHDVTSVAVASDRTTVRCQGPAVTLSLRTVELQFPNTDPIIGSVPGQSVSFERDDLIQALTRIETVADGEPLVCEVDERTLRIAVNNPSLGSASEEISVVDGPSAPFAFGVHGRYLLDGLSSLTAAKATLAWAGAEKPLYLLCEGAVPVTAVVMPVKLVTG